MGDSNDRLKQARKDAGFRSARAAALRHGWTPSTYASHENGQTPVPAKEAKVYARAFKVSPGWILTGEGPTEARNFVKVMGLIGAGAEISPEYEQVPEDGLEEISVPFPLSDDAIAFEVQGPSMLPRYEPRSVIICLGTGRDPDSLIGRELAVRTADGNRYLKTLKVGSKRGLYTLESLNDLPIQDVRIVWAAEVIAMVPPGQWHRITRAAPTPELLPRPKRRARR